jgi:hypothetical protein
MGCDGSALLAGILFLRKSLIEMFKKKELKQQVLIPQHLPLKRMLE